MVVTENLISVIIPVHNGEATIGKCLEAVFASRYARFEVIVVDDRSTDDSPDIIGRYPCRLVRLETHAGASAARNAGARQSTGEYLFFIDADCVLQEDTLSRVNSALAGAGPAVVGGTYTPLPFDSGFFSTFQSVFIY
ncbi:MAG TPA: glycosyltransferase family A protein, partial [Nitrospirota bacterium]|nr:glycosyltransferase family A protein [Nitrospirota bacterium]